MDNAFWYLRGGRWTCSNCNNRALLKLESNTGGCKTYEFYRSNFCPCCGAKMGAVKNKEWSLME